MKILVTGFNPFGGEKVNPSYEVVKRLDDEIAGASIVKLEVPTVFESSLDVIEEAIRKEKPDVVLSLGQAGGRCGISVERIGINMDSARICDNAGKQPFEEKIVEKGPDAYFSSLPINKIVKTLQKEGFPASISNTAGTFVCNHVLYGVRHFCVQNNLGIKSGFIHIPYLPEQVLDKPNMPSMSLEFLVKGISSAIKCIGEECR